MVNKYLRKIGIASAGLALMLAGCGSGGSGTGSGSAAGNSGKSEKAAEAAPVTVDTTPVKVKFATTTGPFSEKDFQQYVKDPVAKKYPHITVEYMNMSQTGSSLNELVASGNIPDIVVGYGATLKQLKDLQLFYNMEPLIKKYKLDLTRIYPEMLDYIKINGASDTLGGLPAYNNNFGLFYNKGLFDKFGVTYPKDGMTWEEVGDLGKKITRVYDGVQYRGFFPDGVNRMINQIELNQLDKNDKSTLTTEPWKNAFELWNKIYNYAGNSDQPYNTINFGNNQTAFLKGELAMITGYSATLQALRDSKDMNWDVVTYPQHKDHLGYSTNVDTPNMSITEQSKVKDASFLVIETVLSDEVQQLFSRNAKMSVLVSDKVKQEFAKGIPEFQGKTLNLISMVKLKPSVPRNNQYQGSDTNKIVTDAYELVLKKEKDINTALREADEAMNKLVDSKKKK